MPSKNKKEQMMEDIDLNKYRNYNIVIPVVALLFIKNGKILILDRGPGTNLYSGWSTLPGGRIEKNELVPHEAAIREGGEETGLEITEANLLEVLTFPPDIPNNKPIPTHVHFFTMGFKGRIKISNEERGKISRIRWLTKDQALNTKLTDWSRYAITRYM